MSSSGEFPNPLKVQKPYRKFGFCLFGALVAGATVITILSVWSVVNLVKNHIVEETIQATKPFLPYVYLCSSAPNVYNLTGTIYTGCGDDVSDPTLQVVDKPGGGSLRTDGFCVQETVTVQIMDRSVGGPVATQCVSTKLNPQGPTDIPWQGQLYVMFPTTYQASLTTVQRSFLGLGMNVYFSDYGGALLAQNQFFLRNRDDIFSSGTSVQKFEEEATFLQPLARATMQVQKVDRVFASGNNLVQYPPYGALTTTALPNVVTGLVSLHNISAATASQFNYSAVVLAASISYDEVTLTEKNLVAIIFTLIGSIPGYISYVFLIWYVFFESEEPSPEYTLSKWWRKGSGVMMKSFKRGNSKADPDARELEEKRLALSRGNSTDVPADL